MVHGSRFIPSGASDRIVWIQWLSFVLRKFASSLWICWITKNKKILQGMAFGIKMSSHCRLFQDNDVWYPIDGQSFIYGPHSRFFQHTASCVLNTRQTTLAVLQLAVGFSGNIFQVTEPLKVSIGWMFQQVLQRTWRPWEFPLYNSCCLLANWVRTNKVFKLGGVSMPQGQDFLRPVVSTFRRH